MTTPSPTGKTIGDFKQTEVANVCLLFCWFSSHQFDCCAVACVSLGADFVGFEIDADYFAQARRAINQIARVRG